MSEQFCYPTTPNIEQEAFRLLALFDLRISLVDWTVVEATIIASMAEQTSKQAQITADIEEIHKAIQRLRVLLMELGV